jgi:hypothetical protein
MSYTNFINACDATKLNAIFENVMGILSGYTLDETYIVRHDRIADAVNVLFTGVPIAISLSEMHLTCLQDAFYNVFDLSFMSTAIWESDGSKQFEMRRCLMDLLIHASESGHVHSMISECKCFDAITGTCKHGHELVYDQENARECEPCAVPKYHKFTCDYHDESLIYHLFMAAIYNGVDSVRNGAQDTDVLLSVLVGLYHDIGKPQTTVTYEFASMTCTGFPAHAEVGAIMVGSLWSPDMTKYISFEQFELCVHGIHRHMCGCHGDHVESNMFKRKLLRGIESKKLLQLLYSMRIGDNMGKVSTKAYDTVENHQKYVDRFMDEHQKFVSFMNLKPRFNLLDLMEEYGYCQQFAILLNGTSGVGKSWFADQLIHRHPNMITVVHRDNVIALVTVGINTRLKGEAYVLSHAIYKSKTLSEIQKAQKAWNAFVANDTLSNPDTQLRTVDVYEPSILANNGRGKGKNIDPNLPNFGKMVHEAFHRAVSDAFASGFKVVVIDTMMTLFLNALKSGIPNLSKYFCIDVNITSFVERTESTVATTLEKQLEISGAYSAFSPLHPNAISRTSPASLKRFASLSSDPKFVGTSMHSGDYRPNLVLSYVRTPSGIVGINGVFIMLDTIINSFVTPRYESLEESHTTEASHTTEEFKDLTEESKNSTEESKNSTEESKRSTEEAKNSVDQIVAHTDDEIEEELPPGVDRATKDMNLVEFYDHLLVTHNGDISRIRTFFYDNGFTVKSPMECNITNLSPEARDEHYNGILEIVNEWLDSGILVRKYSVEDLQSNRVLYERLASSIVLIKYMDRFQGPAMWHNRWALQARGAVLFIPPTVTKFQKGISYTKFIRYMMDRGAEVLSRMTQSKGLETQDIPKSLNSNTPMLSRIKVFDKEQQHTCQSLCDGTDIDAYRSAKADGSLFVATVYRGKSLKIMLPVLKVLGNSFIQQWIRMSLEITNGEAIVIPSTSGTLFEGGFMAPYMVTSMLVGSSIITRNELAKFKTYEDAWEVHGSTMLKRLLEMPRFDKISEISCFMFEAICRDRCGLFGDSVHNELAISYIVDRFVFIGMALGDYAFYMPHMLYSEYFRDIMGIENPVKFEEPLWWRITHTSQIDKIMNSESDYIWGRITKEQHLRECPPSNVGFDINNTAIVNSVIIDREGGVLNKIRHYPLADPLHKTACRLAFEHYGKNLPEISYSKVKGEEYYRTHKPNIQRDLEYLLNLARVASDSFPTTQAIADLLSPGSMFNALNAIRGDILNAIDFNQGSVLMQHLYDVPTTGKNPLDGFDARPLDVKYRIALNFKGFNTSRVLLLPIYKHHFPSLNLDAVEVDSVIRTLTMSLKPWSLNYHTVIANLTPASPVLRDLVVACLGQSLN